MASALKRARSRAIAASPPNRRSGARTNSVRSPTMKTFDHVLAQLVSRLRSSRASGFVPRSESTGSERPAVATRRAERPGHGPSLCGPAIVSYRKVYRCPASTWGRGGYVPEAPARRAPLTQATSTTPAPRKGPSDKMPLRIFAEDPSNHPTDAGPRDLSAIDIADASPRGQS